MFNFRLHLIESIRPIESLSHVELKFQRLIFNFIEQANLEYLLINQTLQAYWKRRPINPHQSYTFYSYTDSYKEVSKSMHQRHSSSSHPGNHALTPTKSC